MAIGFGQITCAFGGYSSVIKLLKAWVSLCIKSFTSKMRLLGGALGIFIHVYFLMESQIRKRDAKYSWMDYELQNDHLNLDLSSYSILSNLGPSSTRTTSPDAVPYVKLNFLEVDPAVDSK